MLYHDVETNGIGYVTALFDLSEIEEELLPYAGILQVFSASLIQNIMDTENFSMRSMCIPVESELHWSCIQM